MIKQMKTLSLTLAAALLLASPAQAHFSGAPAYRTTFYNNANHDVEVGHIQPWGGCTYDEVTDTDTVNYRLFGSTSPYSTDELVGYCNQGSFEPIGP